jgi:CubicO group peptidase (beta-lactamase class C family)
MPAARMAKTRQPTSAHQLTTPHSSARTRVDVPRCIRWIDARTAWARVRTRRTHLGPWPVSYPPPASAGSYGWPGIYGTGWYNDPAEDMTTILVIQRAPAPAGLPILFDFWMAAYQAIDD